MIGSNMYNDENDWNNFNDETSIEFEERRQAAKKALRLEDKHYESYSLPVFKVWTDGKYYKRVTIESYGSKDQGTRIRNAVTGAKYNITVGSADEDLFFKVTDAYGRNGRRVPLKLYYDSPEQYENHKFVVVDNLTKEKWRQRSQEVQKRLDL